MNDRPGQSAPLTAEARADAAEARCAALAAAAARAAAERDAWAQELFESNRFAGELAVSRQALADELAGVRERERAEAHAEAAAVVDAARRERSDAWRERDRALGERDRAREAQRDAETKLRHLTSSTIWRLTSPVRHGLMLLLGRPRGRG